MVLFCCCFGWKALINLKTKARVGQETFLNQIGMVLLGIGSFLLGRLVQNIRVIGVRGWKSSTRAERRCCEG